MEHVNQGMGCVILTTLNTILLYYTFMIRITYVLNVSVFVEAIDTIVKIVISILRSYALFQPMMRKINQMMLDPKTFGIVAITCH